MLTRVALMLVERSPLTLDGWTQRLVRSFRGLGGGLAFGIGDTEALLEPPLREVARHARRLHLMDPVRHHEPLPVAFEVKPVRSQRVLQMGRHCQRRSHLAELLDIAPGSGRGISAIWALRYDDLRLGQGSHGSIR